MTDLHTLPAGLPVAVDDGAADHLRGAAVPPLDLPANVRRTHGPCRAGEGAGGALLLFRALGVTVAGLSTQTTAYQREFVERNHVPFDLLSDAELRLTRALRMAWYLDAGRIVHVWYPVFPPDKNAATVLEWLRAHRDTGTA